MHVYLDGPKKCSAIVFKNVSRTPNTTSEVETFYFYYVFLNFSSFRLFLTERLS